MMESSILSVAEPFGEWIILNLQLSDLGVLVRSDCHELCVWNGNDD